MRSAIQALFWFLIVSATTSLVFEAWRKRSADQSRMFHESDDLGDPSSLATFRESHTGVEYRALGPVRTPWRGDEKFGVSAIVLNWSRFRNVVSIVSGFCDPRLQGVIAEIVVWNNSPRKISAEVSSGAERSTYSILTPPSRTNRAWISGVWCALCFQAKDRKFAREFVFPSKVHGVLQLDFQILLHSGMSGPVPFRQWRKGVKNTSQAYDSSPG